MRRCYSAANMLAQEADDQEALDQEADDQLALLQDALDQEVDDQDAELQEADDQLALLHEAWFQAGSLVAVAAQLSALKLFSLVKGSVTTNLLRPAFGFAVPSAAIAPGMSRMPTPSAPPAL